MAEEKKNIQKLTDEELDQVAGGNRVDNMGICQALLKNPALGGELAKSDHDAFLAIRRASQSGDLTGGQRSIIAGILLNKLGLNVMLDNLDSTKDAKGNIVSADTIVNAINAYKG